MVLLSALWLIRTTAVQFGRRVHSEVAASALEYCVVAAAILTVMATLVVVFAVRGDTTPLQVLPTATSR